MESFTILNNFKMIMNYLIKYEISSLHLPNDQNLFDAVYKTMTYIYFYLFRGRDVLDGVFGGLLGVEIFTQGNTPT